MRIVLSIIAITLFSSATHSKQYQTMSNTPYSNIKSDEHIVLFNTSGWFNEETSQWHIPIHGWIYEPEKSRFRKALIAKVIKEKYQLSATADTEKNFTERTNLLLSDNERDKTIVIDIAGTYQTIEKSAANGHFYRDITLDKSIVDKARADATKNNEAIPTEATISYHVILANGDNRAFSGQSKLISNTGLSIISDIDDTVKITNVINRRQLVKATFFDDFIAVEAMADTYRQLSEAGASLHFVSSSPWQLYTPLKRFFEQANFPWADFSLKHIRFKDDTLMNLFKPGTETKPLQISTIIERYPKRHFLLFGDSGEQDPEVYSLIAKRYPEQIKGIYIRDVSKEAINNERFSALVKDSTTTWQLFRRASEIRLPY